MVLSQKSLSETSFEKGFCFVCLVGSAHYRHIQPEFQRAETGADILGDADDRGGEAARRLPISQDWARFLP